MKNKGFTLIELLGVLIILAVIALITFPIIDNVLTNSREQAYERSIDGIIEASRMYVTSQGIVPDTNTKQLSLQTLINSGFLEDKDIIDPRNNESMTGCVVYRWDNSTNQYKYQYSEECIMTTSEECFAYENISIADSYDINYDTCITYFTSFDTPSDIVELICTDDESYSIKYLVNQGLFTYEELEAEGVITNLEKRDGIEITGYDNTCGGYDVVMPKSIDGKDIFSIGIGAFGRADDTFNSTKNNYNFLNNKYQENYIIDSIDLSQATELIYIDVYAFRENNLSKVIFNDNIQYIAIGAFDSNHLQNLSLPNSIQYIGERAFADNLLTSVSLPNSINIINAGLFANNQLSNIVIPNSVQEIGYLAFEGNNLTSLTIPDGVEYIGYHAFSYNQLQEVNLPDSVKMLEATTFMGNPFYDNNQDEFFAINNILIKYNGTAKDIIIPDGIKAISGGLFVESELTSVILPDSLEMIGDYAFSDNKLTSVTIPNSVKEIWAEAFSKSATSNPNLTNIINKTGRSFNWGTIINGTSNYYFETGTVVNSYGNVEITK